MAALSLTIGVILTCTLSVACAMGKPGLRTQPSDLELVDIMGYTRVGGRITGFTWAPGVGLDFVRVYETHGSNSSGDYFGYRETGLPFGRALLSVGASDPNADGRAVLAAGLPFRSFASYATASATKLEWHAGFALPMYTGSYGVTWPRCIPWRPLWTGLALDMFVWSISAGAAIASWGYAVRARRKRRNECVNCGYARMSTARVCSECGHEFLTLNSGA